MSDPILPPPSPTNSAAPAGAEEMTPQEINDGKVLAALGYPIGIIAIVMFFVRNNRFSLFHAKQMVALILIQLGIMIPFMVLSCIVSFAIGAATGATRNGGAAGGGIVFVVGCVFYIVIIGLGIASFVLMIIGLINAIQGKAKPLPIVGGFAAKWFKNVHTTVPSR